MYIEAIIVCVDYADFLTFTLPQAKAIFNQVVVVTVPSDKQTQTVCQLHQVEWIECADLITNGKFDRTKAINEGLLWVSKRDWVVYMDADIWFPSIIREILVSKKLDTQKIYGIDRLMCPDYKSWMQFLKRPRAVYQKNELKLTAFPIDNRYSEFGEEGWYPGAWFFLWHPQTSRITLYPGEAESDLVFGRSWDIDKRELLADVIGIHLDSATEVDKWLTRRKQPFIDPNSTKSVASTKKFSVPVLWILIGLIGGVAISWLLVYFNLLNGLLN